MPIFADSTASWSRNLLSRKASSDSLVVVSCCALLRLVSWVADMAFLLIPNNYTVTRRWDRDTLVGAEPSGSGRIEQSLKNLVARSEFCGEKPRRRRSYQSVMQLATSHSLRR